MEKGGRFSLSRKILNWEWFEDPLMLKAWIYILAKANYEEQKWRGILIPRGSFITSIQKFAENINVSKNTARSILKRLEMTGEITRETTHLYTVINVINYNKYQYDDKKNNTVPDTLTDTWTDTPSDTRTDTWTEHNEELKKLRSKEVNKEHKEQRKKSTDKFEPETLFKSFTSDPEIIELLNEWMENRKAKHAANTKSAIQKNLDKLEELANESNVSTTVYLSEVVRLGWIAFYPLRSNQKQHPKTFQQIEEERQNAKYCPEHHKDSGDPTLPF